MKDSHFFYNILGSKTIFLPELLLWCNEAGMEDMGKSWAGEEVIVIVIVIEVVNL